MPAPLRIAIAGVHIESSTFSPHRSVQSDFEVTRAEALLARYDWVGATPPSWADGVQWLPVLHARALPGGPVERATYDAFRTEILDGLRALGDLDGVLLDIHGAMSVVDMVDVEGALASEIRALLGPTVLISAAMDLHGNVSPELFAACDLLTCYRTAPHVDVWETRERAARTLVEALRRGRRPIRALVGVPILLPGEKTSTRLEPAKGLYALIPQVEARSGIIDAAIWIGYAWADEPRCQGAVVVTGTEHDAVTSAAAQLGRAFWEAREEFAFVAPVDTMDGCLDAAMACAGDPERTPFFISDSGDNPGAGGADDVTYALGRLVARPEVSDGSTRVVYASIVDPAAVGELAAAGVGGAVRVKVGGRIDVTTPPVELSGQVTAIVDDPDGGLTATLQVGGATVILTSERTQYATLDRFERLGIDVAGVDVVVVKIGYLEPELYDAARGWLLALTPGGVDQDIERLPYERVRRPLFPLDRDFAPDLTPLVR